MTKRYNCRRVKIHRNYTLAEAADLLGVHKHTVSRWAAAGLQTTDARRPLLISTEKIFERFFERASQSSKNAGRVSSTA